MAEYRQKEWYEANKDRLNARARIYRQTSGYNAKQKIYRKRMKAKGKIRAWWLSQEFGLSSNKYDAMMGEQNGLCKICGMINDGKYLCVDHDHKTGAIRGLLCDRCNLGIGYFRDSPALLVNASKYLE